MTPAELRRCIAARFHYPGQPSCPDIGGVVDGAHKIFRIDIG
ncbi:hypothetical protein ACWC0C_40060 [Streptomyces sp. NPDC001709]